jgi:hypothetical protein
MADNSNLVKVSTVAPAPPHDGEIYYDPAQNVEFIWNGSKWLAIGAGNNAQSHVASLVVDGSPGGVAINASGDVAGRSFTASTGIDPYVPDATLPGGGISGTVLKSQGITGATQLGRWVGTTMYGPPLTGTFLVGDWVNSLVGTIQVCTAAGSPGTWASTQQGCVNLLDYGGGTALADNSTALNATITALPATGGVVLVPGSGSVYNFTGAVAASQKINVIIQGSGGLSGGAGTASLLRFTPATAARFIDFRSSAGCQLRDLRVDANSGSFAGILVDYAHSVATDSSYGSCRNVVLSITGVTAGSINLNLDQTITFNTDGIAFFGGAVQVNGGATYSNAIHLRNHTHNLQSGCAAIKGTGGQQAWELDSITLEATGNVLNTDAIQLTSISGLSIDGIWAGDLGGGSTNSWLRLAGNGIAVGAGCYLATVAGSTAVTIASTSSGVSILGEITGTGTGVAWGSAIASHVLYGADNQATTPTSGSVVSGYLLTSNQIIIDPGSTNPAFQLGPIARVKTVQWNSSASPYDVLELISKGNAGGWQGTLDLKVSYSAGTVLTAFRAVADTNGTDCDIGFYGHTPVAQPVAPVTLADVIAVIRGCGLSR